jgi:hypothetical protein
MVLRKTGGGENELRDEVGGLGEEFETFGEEPVSREEAVEERCEISTGKIISVSDEGIVFMERNTNHSFL